jgi:hypothetical protein
MHPAITADVMAARQVLAARRQNAREPRGWRSRVGATLIALGETIEGRPARTAWALSQTQRRP